MAYDFITLEAGKGPLYRQLYATLKHAVEAGLLQKGVKLPSIRRLSEDLRVSRTTVEAAYQQLCAEGFLRAKPQCGYFVLSGMSSPPAEKMTALMPEEPQPVFRYNLGSDTVDRASLDVSIWKRHLRDVLNRREVITSYGAHQGEPALREALSVYCGGVRGVFAPPERIVVGAGTQPLLYLLCGLLREKRIALEERGFPQAERVFEDCGVHALRISSDCGGIQMKELYQSGVRAVLVHPCEPAGENGAMPMARRLELLDWARKGDGLVLEDDYNGELRYRARPIPAMQGMGPEHTVYLGSFSKLLLPSVRISYMVLPSNLLNTYLYRAESYNQTAGKIEQLALAAYIKEGQLERRLRQMRKLYAAKSAALLSELRAAFGTRMGLTLRETALCIDLVLPKSLSPIRLWGLATQAGVRITPPPDIGRVLTLGFAGIAQEEITNAVRLLSAAWNIAFHE